MEQSDKMFKGFLRLLIRSVKDAISENDPGKKEKKLEQMLKILQATLED